MNVYKLYIWSGWRCVKCKCVWCREAGLWSGAAAVGREPETLDCGGEIGAESHRTRTRKHAHADIGVWLLSGECKPVLWLNVAGQKKTYGT